MSEIRVTDIKGEDGSAAVNFSKGINISSGVCTATTFSGSFTGSGANITALNAGNVSSGTLPTTRGGTGLTSLGTAGQALKVNSSANGLEYGETGGMVKLASASLTGQTLSNITLSFFTTTYRIYKLFFDGMYFSTSTYPRMRMVKNADNQVQTGNEYTWLTGHPYMQNNGTKTVNVHGSFPNSNWHIHGDNQVHSSWSVAGELTFYNPMAGATRKTLVGGITYGEESDTNQRNQHQLYGQCLTAEDYKGFYLYPASGTISAINYTLYGLVK